MPHKRFKSITDFPLRWLLLNRVGRPRIEWSLIGVLVFGAIGSLAESVSAASLTNWQYDPGANQLEVVVTEGTTPKYFLMAQPARIVVDLPDTEVGDVKLKESYEGAIRQVRVSQFQPGLTRIVLELSPDVALAPEQVKLESAAAPQMSGHKRWVLRPIIVGSPSMAAGSLKGASAQAEPKPPVQVTAKPEVEATAKTSPEGQAITETRATVSPNSTSEPEFALPEIATPKILAAPLSVEVPPVRAASAPASSFSSQSPKSDSKAQSAIAPTNRPASTPPDASRKTVEAVKLPIQAAAGKDQKLAPTSVNESVASQLVLPPTAIGSDVSPVTFEPSSSNVSVPPPPPQAAIIPQEALEPKPQFVQPPVRQTTPLPPAIPQPPDVGVDMTSSAQVLPPPLTLPNAPSEIVIEAPKAPLQVPAKVESSKIPVSSVVEMPGGQASVRQSLLVTAPVKPGTSSTNLEIPSTLRIRPTDAASIRVPPLTSQVGNMNAAPFVPQSPPAQAPSTSSATPRVISQLPAASVMQPSSATKQFADGVETQLPVSSVMQSGGAMQGAMSNPVSVPPVSNVMQVPMVEASGMQFSGANPVSVPPISSVMQSGAAVPVQPPAVIQPPPSSVIQAPAPSPNAIALQSPPTSSNPSAALVFPPVQSVPSSSGITPTVAVPPLKSTPSGNAAPSGSVLPPAESVLPSTLPSSPAVSQQTAIEFGQPLPAQSPVSVNPFPQNVAPVTSSMGWQPQTMFQSMNPAVLLPTGTVLALSYPGTADLKLETDVPRQEVLLLQTEVRDAAGNVVFPQGSYVLGQFQTDRNGSKFIANAVRVGDRTIPFSAESDAIVGNRELSTSTMAIYSGAGALAGGAVSKFSGLGLLLGGAAGAAANYFTAPKPATLQPGQLIPVRVLRDL